MAFATREKVIVNPAHKKFGPSKSKAAHRPRSRSNTGEIVSFVLPNPGSRPGGKGKMAAKKKTKKYGSSSHHNKAKGRSNPGYAKHAKANRPKHHRRNNPGGRLQELLMEGVFATAGAVGSKLLAQALLGANNVGVMGYLANAGAGLALGLAAGATAMTRKYQNSIYVGTVVGIVIRAISDYTPYGSAAALSGMGDYQVANFVTPQRYVDGLQSAQIQIPAGWGAPPVVVASAGVPAGHGLSGGLYDGGGVYDIN